MNTTDVAVKIGVICLAIIGFYLWNKFFYGRKDALRKNGIPALATVIKSEKTILGTGSEFATYKPIVEFVLEIEMEDNDTRRVTLEQAVNPQRIPKVGDKVNILIDPEKPDNVLILENKTV